jgi:hypothetical protein
MFRNIIKHKMAFYVTTEGVKINGLNLPEDPKAI